MRRLDSQLAEMPSDVAHNVSEKTRTLIAHASDCTTHVAEEEDGDGAEEEEDCRSIATTVSWGPLGKKRCPRHRPNRRARKTEREKARDTLVNRVRLDTILEADWESRGLPLEIIGLAASQLGEDMACEVFCGPDVEDYEFNCNLVDLMSPVRQAAAGHVAHDSDRNPDTMQRQGVTAPSASGSSRKRRLDEVDEDCIAHGLEHCRIDTAEDLGGFGHLASEQVATDDVSDGDTSALTLQFPSSAARKFYAPLARAINQIQQIFEADPPRNIADLHSYSANLKRAGDKLRTRLHHCEHSLLTGIDVATAVKTLDELRGQLTERSVSMAAQHGPFELRGRMESLWSNRHTLDSDSLQEALEDITDDLDEQRGILDYCITIIEDALSAEQESLDEEEARQTLFMRH